MKNGIGKAVGATLFAAATAAVWMWPEAAHEAHPDDTVRPIRSAVVKSGAVMPDLSFAGRIKANEDRQLAFKQSGRVQRIPVSAGQKVKKGEKLAWLDPLDFEYGLAQAEAAAQRDRLTCARKQEAVKRNAISMEEVSQAEAQLKQSEAQLALARRALEDTVIVAPFDGEVAKVPASELDMVSPANTIVVFHDVSKVKVDVVLPETLVIAAKKIRATAPCGEVCSGASVSFDSVPGRKFPVRFVEYVSTADAMTQTYVATYVMDAPEDLLLLPGMSATLTVSGDSYRYEGGDAGGVTLPESAVGVSDAGGHFVWALEKTPEEGVFAVKRRSVKVVGRAGGQAVVSGGLAAGERVATAGVSVLTEGRRVRLMAE